MATAFVLSALLERNWDFFRLFLFDLSVLLLNWPAVAHGKFCAVFLFVILWHPLQEEARLKTLASTSTLCTDSSLSLSSGPTSGYNSSNTAAYTASNLSSQDGQVRNNWTVRPMSPDAWTITYCRNRNLLWEGSYSVTAIKHNKSVLLLVVFFFLN